ncbi:MAG: IclR family transcriptional regulator [Anaerolineae bacterium]
MSPTDVVQSVDRALTRLDLLTEAPAGMALGDLSQAANLPKSTTHRLLQTLMQHKLVEQDEETGKFSPGLKVFEMAYRVLNGMELRTEALPVMERLNRETNFTVHLAILDDAEVVYIEKREADRPIRTYSAVGKRVPAHCTALGKVLLAHLTQEELRRIVEKKGLPRYTDNTITTWDELLDHLDTVRTRSYALDNGEHEEMIRCVAAPVRDHRDKVVGAIGLTSTVNHMSLEDAQRLSASVVRSAEEISRRIGYVGPSFAPPEEVCRPRRHCPGLWNTGTAKDPPVSGSTARKGSG